MRLRTSANEREGSAPFHCGATTEMLSRSSKGFLDDRQRLCRRSAAAKAAIIDDLDLGHEHVPRQMPQPPWICPSVRSKGGPVHEAIRAKGATSLRGIADALN